MELEQIIQILKGISSLLAAMSQAPENVIVWSNWGVVLLNLELRKCIEALENMQ